MQPCIEQKKFSCIKVSDRVHFGFDKFWEQPNWRIQRWYFYWTFRVFFLRRVSEDYQAHCRVQLAKDFPDVSAEVLQKFLLRNKNLYLRSFRALQDHCNLEGHEVDIPGSNNYLVFCKFLVVKLFQNLVRRSKVIVVLFQLVSWN